MSNILWGKINSSTGVKLVQWFKGEESKFAKFSKPYTVLIAPNYFVFTLIYGKYFKFQDDEDGFTLGYRSLLGYLLPKTYELNNFMNIPVNDDICTLKSKSNNENSMSNKPADRIVLKLFSIVGYYGNHYFNYSKREGKVI